jgi:hypothetical protein
LPNWSEIQYLNTSGTGKACGKAGIDECIDILKIEDTDNNIVRGRRISNTCVSHIDGHNLITTHYNAYSFDVDGQVIDIVPALFS